jgi:hypothetical protein
MQDLTLVSAAVFPWEGGRKDGSEGNTKLAILFFSIASTTPYNLVLV